MAAQPSYLNIATGAQVSCAGRDYVITNIVGLDQVMTRSLDTGEPAVLKVKDLRPPFLGDATAAPPVLIDLDQVSQEDWDIATQRLKWISPMLHSGTRWGERHAETIALKAGVSRAQVYVWYRDFKNTQLLSVLLPTSSSGGRGKGRLKDPEVEAIIQNHIEAGYNTDQRLSIKEVVEDIQTALKAAGYTKIPHYQTIRRRILWGDQREQFAKRYGARAASLKFDPIESSIKDAEWPLAIIQVDHTELPIIIVSEDTREPMARPWVTFGIDVFSRMVMGMYLSLDPPSAASAGLCISHAILPKEEWLNERNIEAEWPCWGVMGILHMDNAREFRGEMIKRASNEYGIDVHLRPVKKPEYGAHIERLMGTVSQKLKRLGGATFSGPEEKGDYDAVGKATMTFKELEEWLVLMIARYHHENHSGIGTSPLQRYREGLLGTKDKPGRGLPARRLDVEKVKIDFLPVFERTVQDYGVLLDDVFYFDDVLRPWIGAKDKSGKLSRTFPFRRDPRDISTLYFFEPNVGRYFQVRYRDLTRPPVSIWELRAAKAKLREEGQPVDEDAIFRYTLKMRSLEESAKKNTMASRRKQERRKHHKDAQTKKSKELPNTQAPPTPRTSAPAIPGYDPSKLTIFGDDDG